MLFFDEVLPLNLEASFRSRATRSFDADSSARSSRRHPIRGTYDKTSLEQIAKAGVWIFKKLARETREGIRPTSGILPLERAKDVALGCPELAVLLMPMPITNVKRIVEDRPSPQPGKRAKKAARAKAAAASSLSAQGQHAMAGTRRAKERAKARASRACQRSPLAWKGPEPMVNDDAMATTSAVASSPWTTAAATEASTSA